MDVEVAESLLVVINSKLKKTCHPVGFGYHNLFIIIIFLHPLLELPLGNGSKLSPNFVRLMDFTITGFRNFF